MHIEMAQIQVLVEAAPVVQQARQARDQLGPEVAADDVAAAVLADAFPDRPWGKGDNPKTAVWAYLEENRDFEIDYQMQNKLLITVAPDGYLRRVR